MINKKTIYSLLIIAFVILLPLQVDAETADGTLGPTSTATVDISFTIAEQFRISDLQELSLGTYSGTGNIVLGDNVCVYHNGDGSYRVTVTDNSDTISPGDFDVEDLGSGNEIDLIVGWNDTTGIPGTVVIPYGVPLTQGDANTQSTDCSIGGLSASLAVTLLQGNLQSAPAGSYSTELTVLIEAD